MNGDEAAVLAQRDSSLVALDEALMLSRRLHPGKPGLWISAILAIDQGRDCRSTKFLTPNGAGATGI